MTDRNNSSPILWSLRLRSIPTPVAYAPGEFLPLVALVMPSRCMEDADYSQTRSVQPHHGVAVRIKSRPKSRPACLCHRSDPHQRRDSDILVHRRRHLPEWSSAGDEHQCEDLHFRLHVFPYSECFWPVSQCDGVTSLWSWQLPRNDNEQ